MVYTSINDLRKSAAEVDKWIKSLERWLDASLSTRRNESVEDCYGRLVNAFKIYQDLYHNAKIRKDRGSAAKADFKDRWHRAKKVLNESDVDQHSQTVVIDDAIARFVAKQAAEQATRIAAVEEAAKVVAEERAARLATDAARVAEVAVEEAARVNMEVARESATEKAARIAAEERLLD